LEVFLAQSEFQRGEPY